MIYVYDILVNLNEDLIDFYDWEDGDDYTHIRRCPLFKISHEDYSIILNNNISLEKNLLETIKDKTQIFSSRSIEVLPYACIFTDTFNAFLVEFNTNALSIRKSKFLINEEIEICDLSKTMKKTDVLYDIISPIPKNNLIRSEKKIVEKIINELENFKQDKEKINYLYYEWFDKLDGTDKYSKLVTDITKRFTNKHLEFLDILNLLTK